MTNLVGEILGPYEILEEIGSGGMATVYKAYQASLGRHVAVKVLAGNLAKQETVRKRFDREAKAVASMSHPHILPVYDFGEQDGMLYIVSHLVEGGSLKDRLSQPLAPGVAGRIAHEVTLALDYAHRQGVVHRDVKPGNILLDRDGRALLTDFGVAKIVAETQYTQTGTSVGTPAYMSPEQGKGEEIDGRSDIYSLGVVLYEMLTGSAPFRSDTPLGVMHQHVFAQPLSPRSINPRIPRRLEKAILKALAKEPGDRYRTAREMASALERAVKFAPAGELPDAQPDEALTRAVTPSSANITAQRLAEATGRSAAVVGRGAARASWGMFKFLLRVAAVLGIVALVLAVVLAVGGALLLSSFAERTIPSYSQDLSAFTAFGKPVTFDEEEMNREIDIAIKPYALDMIENPAIDFEPPDTVAVSLDLMERPILLTGRLELYDDCVQVYIERLNGAPLYIVGGIVSNGINRGIADLFAESDFGLEDLQVYRDGMVIRAKGEALVNPTPAPTPTLRPSPTPRPTTPPKGTLQVVNEIGHAIRFDLNDQVWEMEPGETIEIELLVDSYPYAFTVHAEGYEEGRGTIRVVKGMTVFRLGAHESTPTTPASMSTRKRSI